MMVVAEYADPGIATTSREGFGDATCVSEVSYLRIVRPKVAVDGDDVGGAGGVNVSGRKTQEASDGAGGSLGVAEGTEVIDDMEKGTGDRIEMFVAQGDTMGGTITQGFGICEAMGVGEGLVDGFDVNGASAQGAVTGGAMIVVDGIEMIEARTKVLL